MSLAIREQISDTFICNRIPAMPNFYNLSPDSLKALGKIVLPKEFTKGATLLVQGQRAHGVWMLHHGRVKLTTVAEDGTVNSMAIAKRGDAIGLLEVISGRTCISSASTITMTHLSFIPTSPFLEFLREHADAAIRAAQILAELCHQTLDERTHRELAPQKLAKFLLRWSTQEIDQGERSRFDLTHEEIGQAIGSSRETVTRIFGQFKKLNMVEHRGALLIICDRPALRRLAGNLVSNS
jgi:CRP-like cAMP-binding protein